MASHAQLPYNTACLMGWHYWAVKFYFTQHCSSFSIFRFKDLMQLLNLNLTFGVWGLPGLAGGSRW